MSASLSTEVQMKIINNKSWLIHQTQVFFLPPLVGYSQITFPTLASDWSILSAAFPANFQFCTALTVLKTECDRWHPPPSSLPPRSKMVNSSLTQKARDISPLLNFTYNVRAHLLSIRCSHNNLRCSDVQMSFKCFPGAPQPCLANFADTEKPLPSLPPRLSGCLVKSWSILGLGPQQLSLRPVKPDPGSLIVFTREFKDPGGSWWCSVQTGEEILILTVN